jgi:hypothetical protein
MMNSINLDFCVIENPFGKNKRPIIFVTRKGAEHLDETIINEEDYEKFIFKVQNFGYVESDVLTFESSQDPDFPVITSDVIKEVLLSTGMDYSVSLENNLRFEFNLLDVHGAKKFIEHLQKSKEEDDEKNKKLLIKLSQRSIYKIPEVGEKVSLYFYLFVECKFLGDKCYINLNGDFVSKENSELRNYLGIFKCDFIRINNVYNPNKIILKSCDTHKDILKKLPMDFSGSFSIKIKKENLTIDKLYAYYLMEVKNNLPLQNRITIEIDTTYNFDEMIKVSKKIKKENQIIQRTKYSITHVKDVFENILKILNPKMIALAEKDEFEKAAIIKADIEHLKVKLKLIEKENNNSILYYSFIKNFHLN